ncbi:MAG: hypothetical protein QOC95_813, partial [Thermoleophilaceae bacterium]|nr:hypothetical protein [Thermoleophilaceae bacterium]
VTFIATPFPPAAVTGSASSVTTTEALLAGSVNPNGTAATYHFEYGTSTAYGASTPEYSAGSDSSPHNENQAVAGLTAGATYHFRIVGTSGSGTTPGNDATFTTTAPASTPAPQPDPAQQPGATTAAATGIGQHASSLNGALDSHGAQTTYHFDYGSTPAYGFRTADVTLAGAAPAAVVAQLTGLEQGNVVHFRLVAINSGGTTTGADSSFTTLGRLKPSLTIKVGGRDRTFPYTYAVTGRVLLPNGVSASDGCSGSVAIQVMSGKRPIATMRTPVTKSCTYKRKVTLRSRSRLPITHGKLRVLSHFSGNHALLGGFSKHASASFGI